jgi:plastocyanin
MLNLLSSLVMALAVGLAAQAKAADHIVIMTPQDTFSPATVEIVQGDTVTWRNLDTADTHNATDLNNAWSTGDVGYEQNATIHFSAPGTYNYEDTAYFVLGMKGTVIVDAAAAPPIALTNPRSLANHTFQFTVTNLVVGKTNLIQASTNLMTWTGLLTNMATTTGYQYTDSGAVSLTRRYYRVVQLP